MHPQSTPTALPAQPAGIDLSANGVEAIVAALNAAGLTVHYTETDGDHALDLHLRPVDEDVELATLSWRQDRQGWYVAEHDAAGVQQSTRPLGDMDLEDVAAEAARILAQIERAEAQIRAEAESSTTPPETERTIKARYLRPEHRLVLEDVEQDRDTVTARLAGGASVEYDADEAVTVAGAKPAEPATDPRRIAYELVLAGVADGLPIPDSINIPSNNTVVTLWAADGDRDAVERWAAYLNLPTPADGRPIGVKPDRVFRSYESETSEHPALPGRRLRVTSLCDLSDAELADLTRSTR